MKIRTLIVDDEPEAREWIRSQAERDPDVAVIGECEDGFEAATAFSELRPDLVFLDVEMPGLDGFGAITAVDRSDLPHVVFVTAHEEFALRAFDVHALDYIVKPFGQERVRQTLGLAKRRIEGKRLADVQDGLDALLLELKASRGAPTWLVSRSGRRSLFVKVDEIDWVEADGNYVVLHVRGVEHVHRATIQALEERLSGPFVRIHRSSIVNVDRIATVETASEGFTVVLRDGTRLSMGDSYRHRLRELRAAEG